MRYTTGSTLYKLTGFLVIALFVCALQFFTPRVYGQCPPGSVSYGPVMYPVPGHPGCFVNLTLCIKYIQHFPDPSFLDITILDVETNGCGGLTRGQILDLLANQLTQISIIAWNANNPTNPLLIPPCPSALLESRISNAGCATEFYNTGEFRVYPDGSYGPIITSYACTTQARCMSIYRVCCNDVTCPTPTPPIVTFVGTVPVEGAIAECGTYRVRSPLSTFDNPIYIDLQCLPQCP